MKIIEAIHEERSDTVTSIFGIEADPRSLSR